MKPSSLELAVSHHRQLEEFFDAEAIGSYITMRLNELFPPEPTWRDRLRDWWQTTDYIPHE